jgi:uncharacterized RDD family membrane protein YckC
MADGAALDPVAARLRRRLVTPEGVDLGLTLASGSQRLWALIIDLLIIGASLIVLSLVAVFGLLAVGRSGVPVVAIIWLLGFFVLRNCYFILFEMGPRAATPGKRMSGLRVVARSGGRLTADAVIARNLMREIEIYLPLSFLGYRAAEGSGDALMTLVGLGWAGLFAFFPLMNKDRLRVGDLLAGTWVINAPRRSLRADLVREEGLVSTSSGWSFTDEQLDAYGIYELQTLEQVLREANWEAMAAVSQSIRGKLGLGAVDDDQAFLTAYYEALRKRLERKLLFGRRRADKHDR